MKMVFGITMDLSDFLWKILSSTQIGSKSGVPSILSKHCFHLLGPLLPAAALRVSIKRKDPHQNFEP